MRRWLSIFLLIVLPLQMSWAVAASYCQHETGTPQHLGHHEHEHPADDDGERSADAMSADVENDCPLCHAASVAALTSFGSALPEVRAVTDYCRTSGLLASLPGDQPERPNWGRSA